MWKHSKFIQNDMYIFISYIADSHNGMQSMKNYRIVIGKKKKKLKFPGLLNGQIFKGSFFCIIHIYCLNV